MGTDKGKLVSEQEGKKEAVGREWGLPPGGSKKEMGGIHEKMRCPLQVLMAYPQHIA